MDAAKRLRVQIAEIDAQIRACGDEPALMERFAVDQRPVDVPGDGAKRCHRGPEWPLRQALAVHPIAALAAHVNIRSHCPARDKRLRGVRFARGVAWSSMPTFSATLL